MLIGDADIPLNGFPTERGGAVCFFQLRCFTDLTRLDLKKQYHDEYFYWESGFYGF